MTEPRSIAKTLAILSICGFASTFAMRFVDPMVGEIARDLGEDPLTVALLSTAFALPYAFVQPILGPVGDALGKERVIKVCLGLLAVVLAAATLSTSLTALFWLRVLSGAVAGGTVPLALAMIGDRVPMADRQVAISRFLIFTISGQLVGSTASGLIAEAVGWRGAFMLGAALAAVAALAITIGFRGPGASDGRFSLAVAGGRYRELLAIPRARALMLFVFFEGMVIFGVQPYIAPLLEARGAGGASEAGLTIAAFASGGILYTLTVAWLLRTLGLRRMLAVAGCLGAAAFATLALGRSWQVDAAAMAAMGIGFYMLHNSFQTQMSAVSESSRGSALSLHAFSYFVGQAIGPALFGFGLAGLGTTATMAIAALAIAALGFVAASVFGEAQRAR